MKRHCILLIFLAFNALVKAQVLNGWWNENFNTMQAGNTPDNDWISTSNGIILSGFHEADLNNFPGGNALSCHLTLTVTVDSILTPKITGHDDNNALSVCGFSYRIGDWNNNTFVSQHNLSGGDTAYIIIYKYSGSQVVSQTVSSKIHAGNQYTNGGGGANFANRYYPLPAIFYTDTFRVGVKMINHSLSNYWYDFDFFGMTYMTGMKQQTDEKRVAFFPNPAKSEIGFQLDEPVETIQLSDIYGKSIEFDLESTKELIYKLHFSHSLKSGIYFISVKTGKTIINSKFIKD